MNDKLHRSTQVACRLATGVSIGAMLLLAFFRDKYDPSALLILGGIVGTIATILTWYIPLTYIFWNLLMVGMSVSIIGEGADYAHPSAKSFFIGIAIGATISMMKKNWQIVLLTTIVLFSVMLSLIPGEVMGTSLGFLYGPFGLIPFLVFVLSVSMVLTHLL